jgi:hypothetical protein
MIEFDDTERFILMEYKGVDGIELINTGQYSDELWDMYVQQCVPLLNEIIDLGYVHRDIKPENAVYDRRKRVWSLIDFGFMEPSKTTSNYSFKGTLPYCVPMLGNQSMMNKFMLHNNVSDIRAAGDYFGFAVSALSLRGHEHHVINGGVEFDLGGVYKLLDCDDKLLDAIARVVISCVDTDYSRMRWSPFSVCKFVNKVDIDWDQYSIDRNVIQCWGNLVDNIIEKRKSNDDGIPNVQVENSTEQINRRGGVTVDTTTGIVVL